MARNVIPKYWEKEPIEISQPTDNEEAIEVEISLSKEDKALSNKGKIFIGFLTFIASIFIIGVAYTANIVSGTSQAISFTEQQIMTSKSQKEDLNQELTELKSTNRVKGIAAEKNLNYKVDNVKGLSK